MESSNRIRGFFTVVDVQAVLRWVLALIAVILLVGIAYFIALQSPFSPDSIHYPSAEPSRFYYIGSQIPDGIMLYRDSFDYHGPLVFLINALGTLIGSTFAIPGTDGVWWLEVAFLSATLIIVFFTLTRCTGLVTSFIVCVLFAGLVALNLQGGNRIEEYGMLLQAIGLSGFVDYFTRRRLTLASVYFMGTSAGLAICLNPLLAVFWIPFLVVTFIMLFRHEGVAIGFYRSLSILLSTLPPFVLIIPWLYFNNALTSCFDQMSLMFQELASRVTPQQQLEALQYLVSTAPFALIALISVALCIKLLRLRGQAQPEEATELAFTIDRADAMDRLDVMDIADAMDAADVVDMADVCAAEAGEADAADPSAADASAADPSEADADAADASADAADASEADPSADAADSLFILPQTPPLFIREEDPPLHPVAAFGRNTLLLILTNLVAFILVLLVAAIHGRMETFLVLPSLICVVLPLAAVINVVVRRLVERSWLSVAFGLVLIVLLAAVFCAPGIDATRDRAREQQTNSPQLIEQQELVAAALALQDSDEPTIVFGDECWVYSAIDSYSATRYAWQPFDNRYRSDLYADFMRQVAVADSPLLIGRSDAGLVEQYPAINDYKLVFKNEYYELYQKAD